MLSAFIAERIPSSTGAGESTQAALEILSCIAFKQPVTQGEIDQIFGDTDKRHLVSVLRQMDLVEEFAGPDGRLRFATTGKFLEVHTVVVGGFTAGLRTILELFIRPGGKL